MQYTRLPETWLAQADAVTLIVALILALMSIVSWYLMLSKAWKANQEKQQIVAYVRQFWRHATLQEALRAERAASSAYQLARTAVESSAHHQQHASHALAAACSQDVFMSRQLRRALVQTQSRLENGLGVLASVGSVAPFVGLFGTVWGIYHALSAIGQSGMASVDKVAGPVGEALIMTAVGLAVAIPAVLAYNALLTSNRLVMAELDHFAQDLHTLLSTGAPLLIQPKPADNQVTAIHRQFQQKAQA